MRTKANAPPILLAFASARRGTLAVGSAGLAVAVIMALTLGGSAQAVSPTKVGLGTAEQFAVLAGSGITNTGVSTISGDVGSSPTSTETGFTPCPAANCVTLTGTNHTDPDPNDAVTQGAKTALATAYNDAAGRTPTTVGVELGGKTLAAGVYTSGGAGADTFGITGELFLDGENNADAVFIFQTEETLITAGASKVTLIRGAQACNVFWKVGTAATLGASSFFKGTIMAHDDISLGDAVTVAGRLLAGAQPSGAGAVTLIGDTITKPSTCTLQADVDAAAAAAAEAARVEAARVAAVEAARVAAVAAEAAKVAAAKAEAAKVAAAKAAAKAKVEAAAAAAAKAEAARVAAAKAAAIAKAAAVKAAAAAKVTAKAKAAAKVAAAKAQVAKVAAVKAAKAAKAAKVAKIAAARAAAARAGFTG